MFKYFFLATLTTCAAKFLRDARTTTSTTCAESNGIAARLNCCLNTSGVLLTAQDPGTATLPAPYNKPPLGRAPGSLTKDGMMTDFTFLFKGMNSMLYQDLGQGVQFNLPSFIFANAGDTAFECIYAADRGDPNGVSCTDNRPPPVSLSSDPVKLGQYFAAMYLNKTSPAYCAQKGIASLGIWDQAGKDHFIATYNSMSEALQNGTNPKLAINGFGAPPNFIPNTCPGLNKHLQFQENQANAPFHYASALAIGYLETRNDAGQNCNAFNYADSSSNSKSRANAVILKDYLKSIGHPLADLPLVKMQRVAKPDDNPILADATKPCGLKFSPVYGDIEFVDDQPPQPGTCDEEFCWLNPGASCPPGPGSVCSYCNKRGCHKDSV